MNLIEQAKKIITEGDQQKFFVAIAEAVEVLKAKEALKEATKAVKEAQGYENKMVKKTEKK
jgi:hypothetical protein